MTEEEKSRWFAWADHQVKRIREREVIENGPPQKHTKWEYKIDFKVNSEELQELGQKGWEMCGGAPNAWLYFKRPILD